MGIINRIKTYIYDRCSYEAWFVGIRRLELPKRSLLFDNIQVFFHLLTPNIVYWYADPIIRRIEDEYYVFMEAYNKWSGIGSISVSKVLEGRLSRPRIALTESFHLSFPEVFKYNNNYYMIPETHSVSQFRFYKMGKDVREWSLYKTIPTEYAFSDTTVYIDAQSIYLITTEQKTENPYMNRLHVFRIENFEFDDDFNIEEVVLNNESEYGYDVRNGGSLLQFNDTLIRVIQESEDRFYGKCLSFKMINQIGKAGYKEDSFGKRIELSDIHFRLSRVHKPVGIHTYGRCDNYEVVDIKTSSISLATISRNFMNKFRKDDKLR